MEMIKKLVAEKYDLVNVGGETGKAPIRRNGIPMSKWESKSYEELVENHNYKSTQWGFRLGKQTNGKHIMSLDFDIYDKTTQSDQPETTKKLNDYLVGAINHDGLYTSSTEGNHNVLIDYTDSPTLIEWVEKVATAKFTYYGLEILLKGNQVIPPTQTICKKMGQLGEPRTFKNINPFYIINETNPCFTFQFIKDLFEQKYNNQTQNKKKIRKIEDEDEDEDTTETETESDNEHAKKKSKKIIKPTLNMEEDSLMDDKFIDLLFNVIGNNEHIRWKQWFLIAGILKTNDYDYELFQLFTQSSKMFAFTEQKKQKTRKVWDSIGKHKHISIYALQNLAKDTECGNPSEYKKWLKKYNIYGATYEEIKNPFECAKLIHKTLKQNLIYCKKEWYMITPKQLWKNQKEPTFYVLEELKKYLDFQRNILNSMADKESDNKDLLKNLEKWIGLYEAVTKPAYLSVLIKCLQPLLSDDLFSDTLNTNTGQLAFKNGIMDLETRTFREGIEWFDFISETIPYDYEPSEYTELKKILKPILNNNDEHLEYFLSILGYTFIGEADLQKSIYFMIDKTDCGKGDNGKTFFFDILNTLMPNYVYRSKASLLEINNTKVHKQIVMTKGKRLIWLEELPKEKYMNPQIMKEIADGKTLENEIMYGTSESINVMFKMFALSNHIPKIDPSESAVYNRYKQVSFNSHFDRTGTRKEPIVEELKFVADPNLPDKVKTTMYNEVFNLIIDYAHKFYTREKKLPPIPQQFLNDTKETQAMNDEFGSWFDENCERVEGGKIPLELLIYKSQMKKEIVKEGMARKGFKYNSDLSRMGKNFSNKPYKGGFQNVKLKEEEEEEEEVLC